MIINMIASGSSYEVCACIVCIPNCKSGLEDWQGRSGGAAHLLHSCISAVASSRRETMGRVPQQLLCRTLRITYRVPTTTSPSATFCTSQDIFGSNAFSTALTRPHRQTRTRRIPHLIHPRLSRVSRSNTYTASLLTKGALPPARNMSSDADYASFLDKANQDTGAVEQQSSSKKSYGTKSVNTVVPKALEQVEEYYTSDADEPFEPVALKFNGSSVSAGRHAVHSTCRTP